MPQHFSVFDGIEARSGRPNREHAVLGVFFEHVLLFLSIALTTESRQVSRCRDHHMEK